MSKHALVLASHGGGDESEHNAWLRTWAERLHRGGPFEQVGVAFNLGSPHYSEALDQLDATEIAVVPVLTSDGHFCRQVLPAELARNKTYAAKRVRITSPLGTHPGIARIMRQHAAEAIARFRLDTRRTALLVVGHGTRRDAASQMSTNHLAALLGEPRLARRVAACFLEADPMLEAVAAEHPDDHLVILPFFIGGAVHTKRDLPERLGLRIDGDLQPPTAVRDDRRAIVFTPALGHEPALTDILRELALSAGAPTRVEDVAHLSLLASAERKLGGGAFRPRPSERRPA